LPQITLQSSHSVASLRGIYSVDSTVAWASGADGTVLRTYDGGKQWENCASPPQGEKLDFRGVWAWSKERAIVLSSGTGDQSRLYLTDDGCKTWRLLATNPDANGFWDAVTAGDPEIFTIFGDPVEGRFRIYEVYYVRNMATGRTDAELVPFEQHKAEWQIKDFPASLPGEGAFAASNSCFLLLGYGSLAFGTGGPSGPRFIANRIVPIGHGDDFQSAWYASSVPLAKGESAGVFAIHFRENKSWNWKVGVAVGGDYKKPDEASGSAAYTTDSGKTWLPAIQLPHGYRSAVTYDDKSALWITVGPNGVDLSADDGKNWRPMPGKPETNNDWNAISLPFVVGSRGRIGRISTSKLP